MPFAAVNRWLENIYCSKKIMLDEFIKLLEDILLPLFCVYLKYLCVCGLLQWFRLLMEGNWGVSLNSDVNTEGLYIRTWSPAKCYIRKGVFCQILYPNMVTCQVLYPIFFANTPKIYLLVSFSEIAVFDENITVLQARDVSFFLFLFLFFFFVHS